MVARVPSRGKVPSIFYEEVGRGRPFVMLHGSPSDHRVVMEDLEPVFTRQSGWRRVYPDLPGHGRSPGSSQIRDMDGYLSAILDLLDEVAPSEPIALGGVSFGAYLALGVARRRSSRLSGLLLSVPEIHHGPREDAEDRRAGAVSGSVTTAFLPRSGYREDTRWLQSLPFRDVSIDLNASSRRISVPTLILLGREDADFRTRAYWKLLPSLPQATFALLDAAGHALWRERGDLARSLVADWLERIPKRVPHGQQRR